MANILKHFLSICLSSNFMYRVIFSLLLFLNFSFLLKGQISESFNDGDFTNNPSWTGNVSDFIINSSNQLQSNNTTTNSAYYIVTTNTLSMNCQWEFWSKLQFNTSSANFVDIYLISNNSNLQSSLNGYFVRLGGTNDEICLYKQTGTSITKIIDGVDGVLNTSNNTLKVKIIRDSIGVWTLSRDISGSGLSYIIEGAVSDTSYLSGSYFGLNIKQSTASFFQKHFFDDFYIGPIVVDTTPPTVLSATLINTYQVDVLFNEPVDLISSQTYSNYVVSPAIGYINSAIRDVNNQQLVHLYMTQLSSGTIYTLQINQVQDLSGNIMNTSTTTFSYYKAIPFDIVFNEIMADPDPPVGLPNTEYIELKNNTNKTVSLKNWLLSSNSNSKKLPDIKILPDSFIVLCGTGAGALFSPLDINIQEVSGFPSLTNSSGTLTLRDSMNNIIHSISYYTDWYHNSWKADGGWSIEQIDPKNPCGEIDNWSASTNIKGGTPGEKNSIDAKNLDITSPHLSRVLVPSSDTIVAIFSESMDSISLVNINQYNIDQGIGNPTNAIPVAVDFKKVKLPLPSNLQTGIVYHLTVNAILKDCAGNGINTTYSLPFALPQNSTENDIIINEVLFDPKTGGVDFVELYNRSQKVIDLKGLRIGSTDTITGSLIDTKTITSEGYLLFPNQYVLLSESGNTVKQQYLTTSPNSFLDVVDLPAMNADEDIVTISNTNGLIIDQFHYTDNMHFPLLNETKGVSLERIDFDRPSNDHTNWNSASANVGFATPGYQNSQYLSAEGGNGVVISNEIFSPDNDGYQDVLDISYQFNEPGQVANVFVYDNKGRQIRYLVKNEQLNQNGVISWNGITDHYEKAPIGIYIIYFEVFNTKGNVNKYKLHCVLAGKL